MQEMAAGHIGDPFDHAVTASIDQEYLAHHTGRGARHERCERGDGGLLDPFGGDDHAQHERGIAIQMARKPRPVITLSRSNQPAGLQFFAASRAGANQVASVGLSNGPVSWRNALRSPFPRWWE